MEEEDEKHDKMEEEDEKHFQNRIGEMFFVLLLLVVLPQVSLPWFRET